MEIRRGVLQDTEQILVLYHELFGEMAEIQPLLLQPAKQEEGFVRKELLSPMADFYVATRENIVLGFALITETQAPPYNAFVQQSYGYLMDVIVSADFRGKGLGKKLIEACINWSKKRELAYVELNVLSENKRAAKFYETIGFQDNMRNMLFPLTK